MIYVVSKQLALNTADINYITPDEGLKKIPQLGNLIGWDTETTGLSAHSDRVLLLQLGNQKDQLLFDNTIDLSILKPVFENPNYLFIGHNLKFDIQFLYKYQIIPVNIYDTMVAERLLYLGYAAEEKPLALKECLFRYFGVMLDKNIRSTITSSTIYKPEVIKYSAKDVEYLIDLRQEQLNRINEYSLHKAIEVEMEFVKVLAYTEFCGIKLSEPKWRKKMWEEQVQMQQVLKELEDWMVNYNNPKYLRKDRQLDLFGGEPEPVCNINWASSKQVVPLFKELGIDTSKKNKRTGKISDSVEAKIVGPQKHKSTLIPIYLRYKALEKCVSTYGQNVIDQINPNTGRIHTNFTQLVDTARLSSGGTKGKIKYINLQNLPNNAETREAFVSEPAFVLIDADYSAQEQIVLANESMDKDLLHFYDMNLGDMHSYNASKIYPHLKDLDLKTIKEKYPEERNRAKAAGFAINYGGDGNTIAENLGITPEEGAAIFDSYFQAFPGLKGYFDKVTKEAVKKGYITICKKTGHKRFLPELKKYMDNQRNFDRKFWEQYRAEKAIGSDKFKYELYPIVKEHFKIMQGVNKKALNTPIQGTSAIITKIAGIKFFNYLIKTGLIFKTKIVNFIHDEILVEESIERADKTAKVLKHCMESSGSFFYTRVRLKATPIIGEYWKH